MRNEPLVVVREIAGAPAAAVVTSRFDANLDRSEVPLLDHKLLFCSVPTLDEAVYLTAFINSTPAQDFLMSYASTTGVTPRALATLPIPPVDPKQADIGVLIGLGRDIYSRPMTERAQAADELRPDIDRAVLHLGNIDPSVYTPPQSRPRPREVGDDQLTMFDE